jgi:hypothetical protein
MLVVYPGQVGPSRRLVDVLRERHEDHRASVLATIAHRNKGDTPLTESVDWPNLHVEARQLVDAIVTEQEGEAHAIADRLARALSVVPRDPGDFVAPDGLDDITLRPRHLSALESLELRRAMAAAYAARDDLAAAHAEARLVARVVAEVGGLTMMRDDGSTDAVRVFSDTDDKAATLDDDDIEALRGSGLLPWLVVVAVWWQSLPSGKVLRSGVRPPST